MADILDFENGAIIHRVKPGGLLGADYSYMSLPVRLVGVQRGCIFLHVIGSTRGSVGEAIILAMHDWSKDWDYFPVEVSISSGAYKHEDFSFDPRTEV